MPDTTPSAARIRELTAQRNAVLDANEELHRDLVAAVEAVFARYHERIAWVGGDLKRERGRERNGRCKR